MNKITLIGRLGQDPEVRIAGSGNHWMRLSIATNRPRKEGEKWVEEADWHNVKLFGKDADYIGRFCRKGTLVYVEGSVHYETWNDKDNQKRWSTAILADRVGLLADGRPAAEGQQAAVVVESGVESASAK